MAEEMIFDPSQKKKKKSKTKKTLDLGKALEQSAEDAAPGTSEAVGEAEQSEVAVSTETPAAAPSEGVDADMSGGMFAGKKKKKPKAGIDMSEIQAAVDDIDSSERPASGEKKSVKFSTAKPETKTISTSVTDTGSAGRDHGYDKDDFDSRGDDYTYDELLKRVFNIIREKNPEMVSGEKKKFVMKPPQISKLGTKKTAFGNFADTVKSLDRQPKHVLQFLLTELGTSGTVDGNSSLIIKGRFQQKQIESVLRSYIKEYVMCHTCKSRDTKLDRETRLYFLQCNSCGARCSVTSIQMGFKALVTKRAVLRRKIQ